MIGAPPLWRNKMDLSEIKKKLAKQKLDALIITRNNMFLGQDILPDENRLRQLTGFTGSAGRLLVRPDGNDSVLFVDGRYELQAAMEVSPPVSVVCTANLSFIDWLKYKMPSPAKIGFNPWCLSINEIERLKAALPEHKFIPVGKIEDDFLLSAENCKAFSHNLEYAGISADEKLSELLPFLSQNRLDGMLITAADSVSWLLNLRARCLPDTPVLRAFALIDSQGNIKLFADNTDFSSLTAEKFETCPLKDLQEQLRQFKKRRLGITSAVTPFKIEEIAEKYKISLIDVPDICAELKCIKNEVELQGIRKAHLRDGAALAEFLYWLESAPAGQTELDIVAKLYSFRQKQENFFSNSFETIAAYGPNGAIVHYQPHPDTNLELADGSLLLLDSGGQYFDGTTDVTRTLAVGTPHAELIKNYTYVLKAHIALASAVFPDRTPGQRLDILARKPLWQHGLDYNHGTGHGVGCFSNVHEGPIGISTSYSRHPLQAGMITSIEPGYYLPGKYGIRIENLAEIIKDEENPRMLKFTPLTYVPFERRLIDKTLLENFEISWIDNYHAKVFQTISPLVNQDVRDWLEQTCRPL